MTSLPTSAALLAQKNVDPGWTRAMLLACRSGGNYPSAVGEGLNNEQKTCLLLHLVRF